MIFFRALRSLVAIVTGILTLAGCAGLQEESGAIRFYVGSSNGQVEHSIYLCELDPVNEKFSVVDSFAGATAPSYLDLSPDRKTLYAINHEISDQKSRHQSVYAFRIDREILALELLNSQPSQGEDICHVHCNGEGTHLFVANYSSGHTAAFPLEKDGSIKTASSVVIGEGEGPVKNRQQGPHAHQVMSSPDGNYLLVPDLGTDRVMNYAFNQITGELTPNPEQPFLKLAPGAGPRHLVFHPSGAYVYVVNELNSTVTACSFNHAKGILTELQTISTVEESHEGSKYPAAIRIHPDGKYLYASTRGENSCISLFGVEEEGTLTRRQVVEHVPLWPRDFNIDPPGTYLIAAGERSDEIELFRIDSETGALERTGVKISLPSPGCILFIE